MPEVTASDLGPASHDGVRTLAAFAFLVFRTAGAAHLAQFRAGPSVLS